MIPISKCTQTVTFYVTLKSTWIFKQIKNKNLFCSCKHIEISTRLFFRLDLGMVMGGDGFEIHACACKAGQVRIHAYCQKHMHLVSSSDKANTQRLKKKTLFPKIIFKYFYFIKCFFKYNSTNMEVIIAAV